MARITGSSWIVKSLIMTSPRLRGLWNWSSLWGECSCLPNVEHCCALSETSAYVNVLYIRTVWSKLLCWELHGWCKACPDQQVAVIDHSLKVSLCDSQTILNMMKSVNINEALAKWIGFLFQVNPADPKSLHRFYIEKITFLKDNTTVELFFLNAKSLVFNVSIYFLQTRLIYSFLHPSNQIRHVI